MLQKRREMCNTVLRSDAYDRKRKAINQTLNLEIRIICIYYLHI